MNYCVVSIIVKYNLRNCVVLAILLGSVKVPYEEIRRRIVEFDEENLTSGLMEQLIKYLPSHEQMNQLAALRSQYADLAEPEQFVVVVRVVGPIPWGYSGPSVTHCRCRCRGHRCACSARQYC